MTHTIIKNKSLVEMFPIAATDLSRMFELKSRDQEDTLAFLSTRSVHTVAMASFINDNGIESELNRGKFFGYRNIAGKLEGVALIGHSTLVDARSEEALRAFAVAARSSDTAIHLIMSDRNEAESFWKYYGNGINKPRLTCTELLFELNFPFLVPDSDYEVRLAHADELLPIADAQAGIAYMECGVDPMTKDREGFLKRVARRIEQGRVFVVFENDKIVFKGDIVAKTADVVYLEGIYVAPENRGKGTGSSYLAKLSLNLLDRVQNICLLSNVEFTKAHKTYANAGYKNTGHCTTLFV